MEFYKCRSSRKPSAADEVSSAKYVYITRNVKKVETEEETGYEYEECRIPKDVYEFVKALDSTEARINDIEDVIADMIGGDLQ